MGQDYLKAAGLSGAALGILYGYWVGKSGFGFPIKLEDWLTNSNFAGPVDVALFAGLGAIAVAGLSYVFRHNSN